MLMRRIYLGLLLLLLISTAAFCGQLQIHAIDVGQGDCTLIVSPDGKTTVLIDAGDDGFGAKAVLPYLKKQKIDHLSYVFASHYDSDHIGGMDEVLGGVKKIGTVYDRGDKPAAKKTATFRKYAKAAGSHRKTLKVGQVISLGPGCAIKCISEDGLVGTKSIAGAAKNENNLCVGLLLTYKKFRYFTSGDSGGKKSGEYMDVETSLADAVGHVNAIKVDHHGSATSSNDKLLKKLQPEVGNGNKFHHPTQSALDRLVKAKCAVYQTEKGSGGKEPATCDVIAGGAIKLTTDGVSKFSVACGSKAAKAYPIK